MTRHCNGTDPNLLMYVDGSGNRIDDRFHVPGVVTAQKPCDCGRTFDDIKYSTIYPHERI